MALSFLKNDRDSSHGTFSDAIKKTSTSLIIGIINHEEAAWNRFCTLYTPLIRFWCKKPGGLLTRSDRQDITQEVLIKVHKAIPGFNVAQQNRSLRAWLRTITQNAINDYLESTVKRKGISQLLNDTGQIKNFHTNPIELCEEDEERIILLRQVLETLRPQFQEEHWEILKLFINAGKTSGEVAEIMSMKPDTVRKIKNRMLKKIREEYQKLGLGEAPSFDS